MALHSALPGPATLGDDLARVEAALRAAVRADDDFLTEVASHLILAGGKRVRPGLAMASARTAGDDRVSDDVVLGGVAVELVHLGSLYHDDVMDEAAMRRTVQSVNARWGNLRAIVAGDFLLARASEIAASLGTEVAGLLAATIGRLCEGQIREMQTAFDVTRSEDAYVASIEGKTASLFASACRIGAIVGGLERTAIDALTRYGHAYGMAFQVVDDVLDVTATAAELGKPAGHDLVEGVYTLPVIVTLAGEAGDELADLLGRPIDGPELDKALAVVRTNGGVPAAVATARGYGAEAQAALASLGSGAATDRLHAAVANLLDRV